MKKSVLLILIGLLFVHKSDGETCKEIRRSDLSEPCQLSSFLSPMSPCRAEMKISTERECAQYSSECCWMADVNPPCFKKPVKCYVDLRPEKCIRVAVGGVSGIFTGYSANGTWCQVSTLVFVQAEIKQLLGYHSKAGFRINHPKKGPPCRSEWSVDVTKTGEGNCSVFLQSTGIHKSGINPGRSVEGRLQLDSTCVLEYNGHLYAFDYNSSHPFQKKCMCTVDTWIADPVELLPLSRDLQRYIQNEEQKSSCTQILGNMLWSSWRNRIKPVNTGEVNAVFNAFANLTDVKSSNFSFYDADILLGSTHKVSQYEFYEGIGNDSGSNMIKKMTKGISNIIKRWNNMSSEATENGKEPAGLTEVNSTLDQDEHVNNASKVRWSLFRTMESITQSVAKRLLAPTNGSELLIKASESRVNVHLALATNASNLVNQSHSGLNKRNNVNVTTYPNPPGTGDDVRSVAVISVFYNYPQAKGDERVSNYLTVDVRSYVKDHALPVSVPVRFSLQRQTVADAASGRPTCAFLVPDSNPEIWDTFGCTTVKDENAVTTCECNHTTNFAVLMKAFGDELPAPFNKTLEILSMILSAVSIALLSVTLLVFVNYRRVLLKERMLIHFHLIIAVLCGNVSLMIGTALVTKDTIPTIPCIISAMSSHFFFLAVFMWSFVEGAFLFYKIVLVFHKSSIERLQRLSPVVGWVFPAIIVFTSFIISRTAISDQQPQNSTYLDPYANPATCFLTTHNGMIWSFLGPFLVIVSLNMIVLLRVSMVIYISAYSSSRLATSEKSVRLSGSLKRASRGALLLMPILGIPWVVGLLYNFYNEKSGVGTVVGTIGSFLHVILAGSQGIALFVFYCFYNSEVRGAYTLAAKKRKSEDSLDGYRRRGRRDSKEARRNYFSLSRLSVSTLNLLNARRATETSLGGKGTNNAWNPTKTTHNF